MLQAKVKLINRGAIVLGLVASTSWLFPAYALDMHPDAGAQQTSVSLTSDEGQALPAVIPLSLEQTRSQILTALNGREIPVYLDNLVTLYAGHNMQPLWHDKFARQAFEKQLAELALAGVQPQFARWMTQLTDPSLQEMSRDVVLSDAMLGYLAYLASLPEQGERLLYGDGGRTSVNRIPTEQVAHWVAAVDGARSAEFISALAPQSEQYAQLQQTLALQLASLKPWPRLEGSRSLRPGESSPDVAAIGTILSLKGLISPQAHALSADGVYRPELVEGIKRFQREQGLDPDGVIGAQTRNGLNITPAQRAAIIALNMQRLRLLPADVRSGIMVNIPDYSLVYYINGDKALQSRVIVGRPDRKTPLMRNALNNVVVNPPWNVPESLARNDILPKVHNNPGYLESHGYALFRGWSRDAEPIDPWQVDWSTITARNLPFRFQQKPGPNNSLGRYKFNMPNSEAIYLHDTPNHNLFNRQQRAISSGCVRVNKAAELADMLLKDNGWNSQRIADAVVAGNTRYISIRQRVPVTLYYLTAFADPQGQTAFRTDIYNYDKAAFQGAAYVEQARTLIQQPS